MIVPLINKKNQVIIIINEGIEAIFKFGIWILNGLKITTFSAMYKCELKGKKGVTVVDEKMVQKFFIVEKEKIDLIISE